jgi:hypothetical protein
VVLADVDGDGKPEIITVSDIPTPHGNPFFPFPWEYNQQLTAFRRDGTIARSWQLTGMNGYDVYTQGVPAVGDFSGRGRTEIAVAYTVSGPGDIAPSMVYLVDTGIAFNAAAAPWPYVYNNRQNNPVLLNKSGGSAKCAGCYFLVNGVRATVAFDGAAGGAGSFTYNYRSATQTVQFSSTSVATVSVAANTATLAGQGKLNGQTGYSFTVIAKDGGAVGSGLDTVSITIIGPSGYSYSSSGVIAGGDIVVKQ